jgi:predicted aldo/keto reductase-like oxidoreductase
MIQARERGLTKFLGITGHGVDTPRIHLEALRRFDFDSVTFPLNFIQLSIPDFRKHAEELMRVCRAKNAGTMIIKSITKGPWGDKRPTATTWYEPFDQMEEIQNAVNFVLSHDVTGLCTAGDAHLLPMVLKACENFTRLTDDEQESMIERGARLEPLFK